MKNRSSCSGSFLGLFFLLFLILKLTHVVDWSWWWVTSPLWLPAALGLGGLLVFAVLGFTGYKVLTSLGRKRREESGGAHAGTVVEARGTEAPVTTPPAATPPAVTPPAVTPPAVTPPAGGGHD